MKLLAFISEDLLPPTMNKTKLHNFIVRLYFNHKTFIPSHPVRNIQLMDNKNYFEGNNGASSFLLPPMKWKPPKGWSGGKHSTFLQKDIQLISTESLQLFLWFVFLD